MSKKATLAKISRPRLFGVVPRERLFALLDDNRGRPLVWIFRSTRRRQDGAGGELPRRPGITRDLVPD